MQKIIVIGFPHTGTTILKSIIGHIDEVEEIIHEEKEIRQEDIDNASSNKKFIMCKWPFARDHYFDQAYQDYIKIFIIRNPLWIFSSLNKRCAKDDPPGIPPNHGIDTYIEVCKKFLYYQKNPTKNVHLIKYEDMFDDNYQVLKNLFNTIGFNYHNNIFNNSKYTNFSHRNITQVPNNIVDHTDHENFRTWQINQKFVNNNIPEKIDLLPEQITQILSSDDILNLYPELACVRM